MLDSYKYLQDLLSSVFGGFLQKGFVVVIAGNIHACGNTIDELYENWEIFLPYMCQNNLNKGYNLSVRNHYIRIETKSSNINKSYIISYRQTTRYMNITCFTTWYVSLEAPIENSIKEVKNYSSYNGQKNYLISFHAARKTLNLLKQFWFYHLMISL